MALWIAVPILVAGVAAAVAIKLLVRRRAPRGGFFTEVSRSAGAFGVLGTLFAVILAFVIFLALQSYGRAREDAGAEAVAVTEMHSIAEFFPPAEQERLQGDLTCYGRAVISDEWPAMKHERTSDFVEAWLVRLGAAIEAVQPVGARQETAYGAWFDQEALRRDGRRGRLAEASPLVPAPVWVVLAVGAALVIAFMCLQADSREGVVMQSVSIAFTTALVIAGLLVVAFLDQPYEGGSGSIRPTEMRRTLELIARADAARGTPVTAPCDDRGRPVPA